MSLLMCVSHVHTYLESVRQHCNRCAACSFVSSITTLGPCDLTWPMFICSAQCSFSFSARLPQGPVLCPDPGCPSASYLTSPSCRGGRSGPPCGKSVAASPLPAYKGLWSGPHCRMAAPRALVRPEGGRSGHPSNSIGAAPSALASRNVEDCACPLQRRTPLSRARFVPQRKGLLVRPTLQRRTAHHYEAILEADMGRWFGACRGSQCHPKRAPCFRPPCCVLGVYRGPPHSLARLLRRCSMF